MLALRNAGARLTRALAQLLAACWLITTLIDDAAAQASRSTLKIATWNLEWLISPPAFKQLKDNCAPQGTPVRGDMRRLPCDVASRFERSSRDFSVLARYARELDADIIALQEVDGPSAARLVFPDYEFCFTARKHVQNTGFAVRRGVPFRCMPDAVALSMRDSLRRGAELAVFPGEPHEVRLLVVHLKSGCSSKPLTSGDKACRDLARQVPVLETWIDTQAKARRRFAVMGDFNRDLLSEESRRQTLRPIDSMWAELDDADPPEADLHNAASGGAFRNCTPGQSYRGYIDNIVLSNTLAAEAVPGSFARVTYSAADARHARLSDHCPVLIRLGIGQMALPPH